MHLTRNASDRPRRASDFYPTPPELCLATTKYLKEYYPFPLSEHLNILDPGAGTGVWGQACSKTWEQNSIIGLDIRELPKPKEYCSWVTMDYLDDNLWEVFGNTYFDLIVGNPPYSVAEEFVRRSLELLAANGVLCFLLRLEFLSSQKRCDGLFKNLHPDRVLISSRRPSFFSSSGTRKTTDAMDYALYIWTKPQATSWTILDWMNWDYEK